MAASAHDENHSVRDTLRESPPSSIRLPRFYVIQYAINRHSVIAFPPFVRHHCIEPKTGTSQKEL